MKKIAVLLSLSLCLIFAGQSQATYYVQRVRVYAAPVYSAPLVRSYSYSHYVAPLAAPCTQELYGYTAPPQIQVQPTVQLPQVVQPVVVQQSLNQYVAPLVVRQRVYYPQYVKPAPVVVQQRLFLRRLKVVVPGY